MITEAPQVKIGGAFASPSIKVKVGGAFRDAFAPPFDPSVLLDGLVAWWDFEEESGTRVDAHGVYDLTDNNGVGVTAGRTGTNAASFTAGASENLTSAQIAAFRLDQDLTHVLWFKVPALTAGFLSGLWGTQGNRQWLLRMTGAGVVQFGHRTATNNFNNIGTYTPGVWHMVQMRYDHDTLTVQARVGSGSWTALDLTGVQTPTEGLSIGGHASDTFGSVAIDAPAFWHRTLPDEEMNALLNGYQYSDLTA